MDALKTDIIFLSVAPLNDEKFLNYFVLCIIGRTMDDDCLVSVNKLQGVIDSLYPILLNNNLEEKREKLNIITNSVTQFELKKIPVPDDLYQMQKDLKIEISRMENAKATLLYLASMFAQFQSQLEPLLTATTSAQPCSKKKVRTPMKERVKDTSESPSEEYAHKKIRGFTFGGKSYEVDTWIDLYAKVAEIMYKEHSDTFDRIYTLRGTSRSYFSQNPEELRMAKRIPGTNIFMESNFSATRLRKNTIKLIELFAYKEEDIQFKIAPASP
jgi:hypothetical protein